jgi:nucleoid-associated protein YgaU
VAPIIIAGGGGGSRESGDGNEDAEVPARYTVKTGDTLSRISREVYGTSGRWAEIFEANRDQLPSPNALRPGQVLEIPR